MTEMTNYPSGSISAIISGILTNVPNDTNPHHFQLKLGHASMAGKCGRNIWFQCNTAQDNRPNPVPVMVMGSAIHERISSYVVANPNLRISTNNPVDFRPRYNIIGEVDFLSSNSVGELKTTKQNAFKYLQTPQENHILQSSIYAYFYQRRYIEIVYLARDTGNFKAFFWPALNNIDTEIERISTISTLHNPPEKKTWKGEKLEPWTSQKTPWECKYCNYKEQCLAVDNMGVLA